MRAPADPLPEPRLCSRLLALLRLPETDYRVIVPDVATCETGTPEMCHVVEVVLGRLVKAYGVMIRHFDERLALGVCERGLCCWCGFCVVDSCDAVDWGSCRRVREKIVREKDLLKY